MIQLFTPKGHPITGTLEVVRGRGHIGEITRLPDGKLEIEYGGGTEMFWNEQRQVESEGERVFLDEDGNEWRESELEVRDTLGDCDAGLHDWVDQTGKLNPATACARCGEPYGDPS